MQRMQRDLFLKEDIVCISHVSIFENNERRVEAKVLGRIKASINANINLVEVDFNNLDEGKVFKSDLLIWKKADGAVIGLKPTPEVKIRNNRITTIVAQIAYRKEETQDVITRTAESFNDGFDIESETIGGLANAS